MQRYGLLPQWAVFILKSTAILLATLLLSVLAEHMGLNRESILLIFLIGTLMVNVVTTGYVYGLSASLVHVFLFNYLFTQPVNTFFISRTSDLMLLIAFFIASIVCGTITSRLNKQRQISQDNARTAKLIQQATEGFLQVTGDKAIIRQGARYLKEQAGIDCSVTLNSGASYQAEPSEEHLQPLAVPIAGAAKTLGTLTAFSHSPITFQQDLLLKAVAAQMAIALERDALYAQEEKIRLAMERERLRSTLLRAVAHDLRSPLTVLAGASGLLSDHTQSLTEAEKTKLAKDINEEVIWLNDLVENILSMTQIQESRLFLRKEEEVVDDVVHEAVKHITPLLNDRRLTVSLPDDIVTAPMDIKLIAQVIINLLDNAVRHTPMGSTITLTVTAAAQEVIFEIADNGPGIDPDIINTLFEGFVQKSARVSDGRRGLGLGLAICQAVVSAHGGSITASNNPVGGAKFEFRLPRGEG